MEFLPLVGIEPTLLIEEQRASVTPHIFEMATFSNSDVARTHRRGD